MSDQKPNRLHNRPPEPISDLELMLDPAVVRDQLDLNYQAHVDRMDELLAGVDRFFKTVKTIADEDQNARAGDFARQILDLYDDVEKDRKREVKPLDDAKKVIQKKLKAEILDLLERGAADIASKMTVYAREKKAREAERLEDERRKLQAAADAAAALAAESGRPSLFEAAAEAQKAAEKGPAPKRLITRGLGSTSSLRERYAFETIDIEKVPRKYLMLNSALIQSEIDRGLRDTDAGPGIPGGRIVDVSKISVRSA